MTGAVKAFNACFKLAKCEYIYWANDDFVLVPLYDYFLKQRAVFRAKEYGHLKDFYLAQRLPEEVISPPRK